METGTGMAVAFLANEDCEDHQIIKTFLRDAGLFWQDTWLECMPEEILNLIYKFVNDDVLKIMLENNLHRSFPPPPRNTIFPHTNSIMRNLHIAMRTNYKNLFNNITINGNIMKKIWNEWRDAANGNLYEIENRLSVSDGEAVRLYIDEDVKLKLNLPVIHITEFKRYNVGEFSISKLLTGKDRVYYQVRIKYVNRNDDIDDTYNLRYDITHNETIKKGVDVRPKYVIDMMDYRE